MAFLPKRKTTEGFSFSEAFLMPAIATAMVIGIGVNMIPKEKDFDYTFAMNHTPQNFNVSVPNVDQ